MRKQNIHNINIKVKHFCAVVVCIVAACSTPGRRWMAAAGANLWASRRKRRIKIQSLTRYDAILKLNFTGHVSNFVSNNMFRMNRYGTLYTALQSVCRIKCTSLLIYTCAFCSYISLLINILKCNYINK